MVDWLLTLTHGLKAFLAMNQRPLERWSRYGWRVESDSSRAHTGPRRTDNDSLAKTVNSKNKRHVQGSAQR